jgi:tetratricopeptide (TPR) repeat protein
MVRFPAAGFGILLAALFVAAPLHAQVKDPRVAPPDAQKKLPEPPAKLPKVGADKTRGLDFLFGALKVAPDDDSAKHVEARIWALWSQTSSDTTALLMTRAKTALDAKQVDVALKLLTAVVKLRPDYIEGWNRRATLYYLQNDYTHSLEDIEQVLVREPRHFGAHAGSRRRKACTGRLPQGAGDQSAPRKGAGTGQDPDRKGRRPRHLIRCSFKRLLNMARTLS